MMLASFMDALSVAWDATNIATLAHCDAVRRGHPLHQRHWGNRHRCVTRLFRISAAHIGPNRFHQNRTVSWLMSIPRSASRSSTLRSDSGYRTYIITTRRMTSGELLKYRNGLVMPQTVLLQRYLVTMHGGRWASSARLTAHAALSNKSAMTTAWPRIS